ncbi:MAG: DUF3795 domain-containing protein [Planctomycetota bacterium]
MNLKEEKNLAGCCGIYCGLCPRYQSKAASKCPGCKILSLQLSCKLYNCCVKINGLVTCIDCGEFPCDKYENFFEFDSFVSHRVCLPNLQHIKKVGFTKWLREQSKRRQTLENLLDHYNEGRSCSFFCISTALMPPALITKAISQAQKRVVAAQIRDSDIKAKAKIVRSAIQDHATKAGIDLKLRKGSK